MENLNKLAPFLLRSRNVETGRERLLQIRSKLAFLVVTTDISDNSLCRIFSEFRCPVYRCLDTAEIERLFGFRGTKVLGFHRSSLATAILPDLKPYLVTRDNMLPPWEPICANPKVAVLGASGIGKHHLKWWNMEGAKPVAFLGSSPESLANTADMMKNMTGLQLNGYSSLQELLDKEQPDVVDVCLPAPLHYSGVKAALDRGCHVLCEKPFVFDFDLDFGKLLEQAEELAEMAAAKRRMLGICTQYVTAAKICMKLLAGNTKGENVEKYAGILTSPIRNRLPNPRRTWADLAPHLLAVAQVLSGNGTLAEDSISTDFQGHSAAAEFRCIRSDGTGIQCSLKTMFRDEVPANYRELTFNSHVFRLDGANDANGVFQMKVNSDWGVLDKEDTMRLLIRNFLAGRLDMPPAMAVKNLDWLLKVLKKA